jgi:hypothetical protein
MVLCLYEQYLNHVNILLHLQFILSLKILIFKIISIFFFLNIQTMYLLTYIIAKDKYVLYHRKIQIILKYLGD